MKKYASFLLFSVCFSISLTRAQSNFVGSGIALNSNGNSSNYVDLGDVYNTIAFPFTIEAWIYLDSYPSLQYGVFTSENDETEYNGFWLYIHPAGTVRLECGNGFGSGYQYRRGYLTNENLPLNQWIHLAAVCHSMTDFDFYFNGRLISNSPTDGYSSSTAITHSGASASIGFLANTFGTYGFDGKIDEVRLWDVARTQTEIRDHMCSKIDSTTSGLIGYWTVDENYTGSTVHDHTSPSENGIITGTVTKITSGAPIGDASVYNYTSNWNGVTVSANDPSGDFLQAGNVTGSPYGVHVYLVDSLPHDTAGLDTVPKFYFGVFCARAASTPGYNVVYHYDYNDGVINSFNESTAALFRRNDGSVTTWSNANGTLDMNSNNISKTNETTRAEYIVDVKNSPGIAFSATDTAVCEKFCIDFFDQSTNNPTSWYWVFDGGNPSTSTQQNPAQICYNLPGTYDVTLITSGAFGTDVVTLNDYITVLATPSAPTITQFGYTLTSSNSQSYQWQFNTVDIPGATNQYCTVSQSGYYTVVVSNEIGCVNSFTVYVLISGVDEIVIGNTSMFPNPAVNQINFDLSGIREAISSLRITDNAGKVLMESDIQNEDHLLKIDVSNFAAGIYFVEASTASQKFYSKFVVQK